MKKECDFNFKIIRCDKCGLTFIATTHFIEYFVITGKRITCACGNSDISIHDTIGDMLVDELQEV